MSTNQVKADPYESQLKRGGRGAGAVYRPSAKGGGAAGGGPGPSHPAQQHSVRPNGGRRRPNGQQWQHFPNAGNGESILPSHRPQQHQHQQQQQQQQQQQPQPGPGIASGSVPRRPVQNNGTIVKPVPPSTPDKSQPDALRPPPVFQFGSFSPGPNIGMQIPARTASAPPNLDEQKREQAQFEATLAAAAAAKHMPVIPVIGDPSAQHHMVRPVHMPVPVQVVASQPPQGMQQPLQAPGMLPQHGMVPPAYTQGAKYQPPSVMASQVATPIVGAPMMGHPQVPSYQYIPPPRISKAIKIVNPMTLEEVKVDSRPPPASAVPQQHQKPARAGSYAGAAAPLSTTGAPYYPHGTESPRFSYSAPTRGAPPVSSVAAPSAEAPVKAPEVPAPVEDAGGALKPDESGNGSGADAEDAVDVAVAVAAAAPAAAPEEASDSEKQEAVEEVQQSEEAAAEVVSKLGDLSIVSEQAQDDIVKPETGLDSAPQTPVVQEQEQTSADVVMKPSGASSENLKQAVPEASDQNGPQPPVSQAPEVVLEVKQGNKKKNKKKLLAKADAAGSTADLYNAYKAPDEKAEEKPEPEPVAQPVEVVEPEPVVEEEAPKELEDWEDAADLPAPAPELEQLDATTTKRYTRDFLLACRELNVRLPTDFEFRPDMEPILIQQADPGPRSSRRGEEDRWMKLNLTPAGRPQDVRVEGLGGFRPGGMSPGIRFGSPMLGNLPPHMIPVRGVDGMSWIHPQRGLIPSPNTPLPAMHKSENRYEVGKVSDEEEQKQRHVKAILNKLTPQNFDKLFEQVQDVGIETASTLTAVISQIFDKAVMEPTFCETYARFCVQLSVALPEFSEEGEKVTFKRVLLNKCQEEFERGKREEEEAGKTEEDGVSISTEEREIKRVKARRRMLGNIRFIGELYKNSMLTERIMHQCIKTLLGEYQDPDEEDVEALCKLMTTIGQLIDHSKAKLHMDAYFDRIQSLSNNQKLSSRLRFGLKDVIDLRKNDWQQRRKVEGPKKIEEVHRDAVQERLAATSRDSRDRYGRSMGGMSGRRNLPPSPAGMSPMGRGMPGRFTQEPRKEDAFLMESGRPMAMPVQQQRPEDIAFVPQGGLGRGPLRGAPAAPPKLQVEHHKRPGTAPSDRGPYTSRDDYSSRGFGGGERPILDRPMTAAPGFRGLERSASDRLPGYASSSSSSSMLERPSTPPTPPTSSQAAPPPAAAAATPAAPVLTEEQLKKKSNLAIEEYYSARDVKEVVRCVEELARPDYHSAMISNWISESFERKDLERELLAKLIKQLRFSEPPVLTDTQMTEGFASFLSGFEEILMDVPKAADYVGILIGKLVADKVLQLGEVGRLVREGGEEKESLLQSRDGLSILGSVLETIRKERSEAEMLDLYRASGVNIQEFVLAPRAGEVDEFLKRRSLQCLDPIFPVEAYMKEAIEKNTPTPEIFKWLETNAGSLFTNTGFLRMVMSEVLNHTVLPLVPAGDFEAALKGRTKKYSDLLKKIATVNPRASASTQRQYIAAVQLFAHAQGHPSGLMTALFNNFYDEEVIPEIAFQKWEDDVKDTTPGREQAIREVGKWLKWLAEAPEED